MRFAYFDALLALAVVLPSSTLVTAAPTTSSASRRSPWWGNNSDSDNGSPLGSLGDFGKSFPGSNRDAGRCNIAQAKMPSSSPVLPPPTVGLHPYHIAIGRGTQNYTCDLSNATAVPVARGAVATLFNVSCIAVDAPALLQALPSIAVNLPDPAASTGFARVESDVLSRDISGHHYFTDDTTPYFNLDTSLHQWGAGPVKKAGSVSAPADAMVGQYGQGDGAAPWLKLSAKDPKTMAFQEVYRVNTAGGQPPATCQGMQAAFTVQYSAEYWFFA